MGNVPSVEDDGDMDIEEQVRDMGENFIFRGQGTCISIFFLTLLFLIKCTPSVNACFRCTFRPG